MEEDKKSVMQHIASFSRYISHYTRHQQEHRQYLASNINIKIMYKLYKERCLSQSNTPVRESYYRYIFNTECNLYFHQLIKYSCQKCDRFEVLLKCKPDDDVTEVKKELHQRKAERVRAKLNESKCSPNNEDLCFSFDLQKTLI